MFFSLTGNSWSLSLHPPPSLEQLGCNTIPKQMWFSSSKGVQKNRRTVILPVVVVVASTCDDRNPRCLHKLG